MLPRFKTITPLKHKAQPTKQFDDITRGTITIFFQTLGAQHRAEAAK